MKKCKDCTMHESIKEFESCKDSEEQFVLKVSIAETIMEKCFDCDYWHNPLPFWHEDIYKIKENYD